MNYIDLHEASRVTGKAVPTLRLACQQGRFPGAIQITERKIWMIPRPLIYGYGRRDEDEIGEPSPLTNDGATTIVLAKDPSYGYPCLGMYVDETFFSARMALNLLKFLEANREQLKEFEEKNIAERLKEPSIVEIPADQRPPQDAWQCILDLIKRHEAELYYENDIYAVRFDDGSDPIPLKDARYDESGLYDRRLFPERKVERA